MAKVSANALLIGTAVCYILGLMALEARLFTAVSDVSVAFLYTALASATIPAVAYGVGSILSRGPSVHRFVILFLVYTIFYQSTGHLGFLGFYGVLSYSILAAGVIFVAKVADVTDKRFSIAYSATSCCARGFGEALWCSDYACATCFAVVIVLGLVMLFLDLDAPIPGSIHAFLAPHHPYAAAEPVFSGKEDVKIQNKTKVKHTNGGGVLEPAGA